jgi:replicative DNA helicase
MSSRRSKPAHAADTNIAAEQALLGCVLRRDTVFFEIHNELSEIDFADPRHKLIWSTVEKLATRAKGRFDAATVADFLHGKEESVERDYLDALADAVSDPAAVSQYVRTVVDLSRQRAMIHAMEQGVAKLRMRGPDAVLSELVDEINGDVLDASRADNATQKTLGQFADASFRRIDEIRFGRSRGRNLRWGLPAMDQVCGPAIPGHLTIIGGRAQMGKTALALTVAMGMAQQAPGGIIELEMQGEGIADRALSYMTDIPAYKITQNLAYSEMDTLAEAVSKLHKLPIRIEARPGLTVEQIRAKMIGMARRHGCAWFIVDHLQIIRATYRNQQQSEVIDDACMMLAQTAKELNAHMIALSQLNSKARDAADDRPDPRHLMYYNSIEPHADLIVFPYRPEVSLAERRPPEPTPGDDKSERLMVTWEDQMRLAKGRAEIICGKNRHGPSGLTEPMTWNGPMMRFESLDRVPTKSGEEQYRADF